MGLVRPFLLAAIAIAIVLAAACSQSQSQRSDGAAGESGARSGGRSGHAAPRDAGVTRPPPRDCDDTKSSVNQGHEELCDGIDNDCDGSWDEENDAGCPTPICSSALTCPEGLVCIFRGEPCAERAECPEVAVTNAHCDPPEKQFYPSQCDPSQCARWQDGTCWADCVCAEDGLYRWRIGCTE